MRDGGDGGERSTGGSLGRVDVRKVRGAPCGRRGCLFYKYSVLQGRDSTPFQVRALLTPHCYCRRKAPGIMRHSLRRLSTNSNFHLFTLHARPTRKKPPRREKRPIDHHTRGQTLVLPRFFRRHRHPWPAFSLCAFFQGLQPLLFVICSLRTALL